MTMQVKAGTKFPTLLNCILVFYKMKCENFSILGVRWTISQERRRGLREAFHCLSTVKNCIKRQLGDLCRTLDKNQGTLFFYKNHFYKNVEAEICPKI